MIWFFIGLFCYYFTLWAERVLVAATPHDLELLKAAGRPGAGRALSLCLDVRVNLAALALGRLLFQVLLTVGLMAVLLDRWPKDRAADTVWLFYGAGLMVLWCLILWAPARYLLTKPSSALSAAWLSRIWPFILFWKKIYWPFVRHERAKTGAEKTIDAIDNPKDNAGADNGQKQELELLRSIVQFGDTMVKQVMQPRAKVIGAEFRTPFPELLELVREAGFSRMPIYDEDLDNVTGILYVKDLLPHLDEAPSFEWQSLIRPQVLLAPESKRCIELLREFKAQKTHMAIVVDEYGGCAGIVTMEDLLEEVTGDIRDEFDEENDIRFRKIDDRTFIFEGQTLLNDVCRITGLPQGIFDEARGAADTLAGMILERKGDIPKPGAEIAWNGYLFTVTAANSRRVEQVKVKLPA